MRYQFLNEPADVEWLKSTALRGVPIDPRYSGFASFLLFGNEDSPDKVQLYVSREPLISDPCFQYVFNTGAPEYCVGCEIIPREN